ncbi:MBL fold metallo-hydrolase [Streptomyces piniterrae]|uniref:MBL fold metallo-hydrolase n=1 Tax=Streptomyces piniterrae TaxID=2571125 RepID=A0A4U0NIY2_9ACTN|nr:MBL fold metallo-hydrolase [Streptomyces piniterrae]TJZ54231.1 MBL fold metallo-hydrolase [Streptomyces piniterrae]
MSALSYTVHTAGATGLHKSSVLISGDREALLVDGQFTLAEQHRVLADIIDSGKDLTAVVVTASDPDYYFGLEVIRRAFPKVRIVATATTMERIKASWESKLRTWAHLGKNLPGEVIIPEVLKEDRVSIEGHDFEIRGGHPDLVWRTEYLWQPEDRAVVGGVLLFAGLHVWTADTATARERLAWAETLAELERLEPRYVVAGHRSADSATDASVIAFTRAYLAEFEEELAKSGNSAKALEAAMLRRHPDLGLQVAAELGSKVATGEMTWG